MMVPSCSLYIAYDPVYAHPLPAGHRFPMSKYDRIAEQLLREGTVSPKHILSPVPCPDEIILLTHSQEYLDKLENQTLSAKEQREIGFAQSPLLTFRERVITQGTIDCCGIAIREGVALNVAGGTHHGFADHGEGFCLLNDFAVAANYLLHHKMAGQILIIDLDVHQGNGTARLFANDTRVFTFSMHGKNNYPFRKEISDLDIDLPDGADEKLYMDLLEKNLPRLLQEIKPDLAFYLAGVDILETDRLGKLKIPLDGVRRRDGFVFDRLREANIPCVVAMGGGYSENVDLIVQAHCNTFRLAREKYKLS